MVKKFRYTYTHDSTSNVSEFTELDFYSYLQYTYPSISRYEFVLTNVKDQNEASVSDTGSLRYNNGKPKMSTLPPEFLLGIAKVLTHGEEKYGRFNFVKGNNVSVPYDSAMRHILAYMSGDTNDSESGEHHLLHAAINVMMMWLYDTEFPELDDREYKKEIKRELDQF